MKLRQGNVFTPVCDSVQKGTLRAGGICMPGMGHAWQRGRAWKRGACMAKEGVHGEGGGMHGEGGHAW